MAIIDDLKPFPPLKQAIFSQKERHEKLVCLLSSHTKEPLDGGCSLLFQLFEDAFCFFNKKLLNEKIKNKSLKLNPNISFLRQL
jgi:hypothetical protein